MKNLKVYWPTVIALALAVSLVSCHNEQLVKEHEHEMRIEQMQEYEETFEEIKERMNNIELNEVVIPEGLELEDEAGYSK